MVEEHSLDVPGARLHYEVRGSGPLLLLIGAPMDSAPFVPLADALAGDFTVVTTDPRGISKSLLDDPEQDSTPDLRADDVHRLITALGRKPAHVFGSSGGAVTGIALVTRYPGDVATLVAHEPPLMMLLPDPDAQRAIIDDIHATYLREGQGPAWEKFFALTGLEFDPGEGPEPSPDEMAELEANGSYMLGHMLVPTTRYEPDIAALTSGGRHVVVAVGATSEGQLAHRTGLALADRLGTPTVEFPGDHGGFITHAAGCADVLRRVLSRP
jgi:pimeloyl-ACP methyl ester carboxylesterase